MRAYDVAPGHFVFIEVDAQKRPALTKIERQEKIQAEVRVSLETL